ncbi:hypothetical protein FOZ60_005492 [Perkinsus olseni]|uniref:Uncharacterized protein n=1 Tax=Perkinsus olseni TaxID=32597 RepID=A0A7J6PGE7_PEROL|nr:hypothetical protein FOZ60_005492 [Perkinsus olseni]
MSAVKEPEDDTKLNLTFKEKVRYAFEDPTPHSNTFMRVIGIVGAVAAFVQFFGRGWFYFVLGIFYVCSGHIICALVGIYLLIVAVIFVTMGAIRYEEARTAEEKEAKDQVIDV